MSDIPRIKVTVNGPYLVNGEVEFVDSDGNVVERLTRAALCRCGLSESKPFCDGSHRTGGFSADTIRPKPPKD
jgi:CDGSH-type Zn-finger protein